MRSRSRRPILRPTLPKHRHLPCPVIQGPSPVLIQLIIVLHQLALLSHIVLLQAQQPQLKIHRIMLLSCPLL